MFNGVVILFSIVGIISSVNSFISMQNAMCRVDKRIEQFSRRIYESKAQNADNDHHERAAAAADDADVMPRGTVFAHHLTEVHRHARAFKHLLARWLCDHNVAFAKLWVEQLLGREVSIDEPCALAMLRHQATKARDSASEAALCNSNSYTALEESIVAHLTGVFLALYDDEEAKRIALEGGDQQQQRSTGDTTAHDDSPQCEQQQQRTVVVEPSAEVKHHRTPSPPQFNAAPPPPPPPVPSRAESTAAPLNPHHHGGGDQFVDVGISRILCKPRAPSAARRRENFSSRSSLSHSPGWIITPSGADCVTISPTSIDIMRVNNNSHQRLSATSRASPQAAAPCNSAVANVQHGFQHPSSPSSNNTPRPYPHSHSIRSSAHQRAAASCKKNWESAATRRRRPLSTLGGISRRPNHPTGVVEPVVATMRSGGGQQQVITPRVISSEVPSGWSQIREEMMENKGRPGDFSVVQVNVVGFGSRVAVEPVGGTWVPHHDAQWATAPWDPTSVDNDGDGFQHPS